MWYTELQKRVYQIITDRLILLSFALILFCILLGAFPTIETKQLTPIFLLWVLLVSIKGLEESKILQYFAIKLNNQSFIAPKILFVSFIFSFFLSIDISLIILLPLTLLLKVSKKKRLFILVAFSTHLGAALSPFGTPQNLFIFSYYHPTLLEFFTTIAPFSFSLFALFLLFSFPIKKKEVYFFSVIVFFSILVALSFLPWYLGFVILIVCASYKKESLDVDYTFLVTFILFIILSNQLKELLSSYIHQLSYPFYYTVILSQFISNVGATLLLHNFTSDFKALLLGSNIGSFGTIIAALANLISYKIYMTKYPDDKKFFWEFTIAGFIALFIVLLLKKFL